MDGLTIHETIIGAAGDAQADYLRVWDVVGKSDYLDQRVRIQNHQVAIEHAGCETVQRKVRTRKQPGPTVGRIEIIKPCCIAARISLYLATI